MNEKAEIISLESLMADEIGGTPEPTKEEKVTQELNDAVVGKVPDEDLLGLKEQQEESDRLEAAEVARVRQEISEANQSTAGKSTSDTSTIYRDTLTSMFGDSISHIVQENEEGEEVEVAIADIEIDKELFDQIVSSKLEAIKEEASKDKISTKGISNLTKDLIEIDRNGGDITNLLRAKADYTDPLDDLDITTVEGQRVAIYLRKKASGSDDDTIDRLIKSYESEGKLEEYGIIAESELRSALQKQVEDAKVKALKTAEYNQELMKSYKKEIRSGLDSFEMNDLLKNKIVTLATKIDDRGHFEIDNAFYSMKEDPKRAARLALFLLDEEEFIKQVTNKVVQETKLTTAKTLRVISKKGDGAPTLQDKRENKDGIIPLEMFK